ncbi:hypothetical protein CVU37_02730 [candidate division BRC1 bacterium HGW-BRC1-1]|jgi:N-acetylmuramoyl-L-alanine amidase|nr:MAG: hypothetical protein CVU37_02730 [candidate division BRC1 bacterium HGW-BRC1-1]
MKAWLVVLAGAVLTAMVTLPRPPEAQRAALISPGPSQTLASLEVQRISSSQGFAARSPISAFSSAHKPLDGIRICIDPGHGGQAMSKTHYTGGTIGVATGQTEGDVNLRVSLCLKHYLEAAGATVIMTRLSDQRCQDDCNKTPELDFRSRLANVKNADLFISVHHNEASNSSANHAVMFYPGGMASAVSLADNVGSAVGKYMGLEFIGSKPGDYRVLDGIRMPGIIVEASFMSNHAEDQRLASIAYNKLEAKAIATGILNYVKLTKGRQVDFNAIFAPIDENAGTAQAIADASFVRKQVIERRSLFGVQYEEVTYDAAGKVIASRQVGGSSLSSRVSKGKTTVAKSSSKKSSSKKVASVSKSSKSVSSSSKSSKSSKSDEKKSTAKSSSKSSGSSKSSSSSKSTAKSSSSSSKSSSSASASKSSSGKSGVVIKQVSTPVLKIKSPDSKKEVASSKK